MINEFCRILRVYSITHFSRKMTSRRTRLPQQHAKYLWIDLEMSGLNLDKDKIMEVACIVTTPDLEKLHRGYQTEIHVDDATIAAMDDWCTKQHTKTGLIDACRKSTKSLQEVELQLEEYINRFSDARDTLYMAGNTIYMDRFFVNKHMPRISKMLHYRLIDVSSFKTVYNHWFPNAAQPHKRCIHRAFDDIQDSIDELKFYKQYMFQS